MHCTRCKTENPEEANYCRECGSNFDRDKFYILTLKSGTNFLEFIYQNNLADKIEKVFETTKDKIDLLFSNDLMPLIKTRLDNDRLLEDKISVPTKAVEKQLKIDPNSNSVIDKLIRNLVYVKGGTFMMGASVVQSNDFENDEKPLHRVTLSSYSIGKYPISQADWRAVMLTNPSNIKGDNLPVENVSWNDCQEFIKKLNHLSGKKYALPSEAQWEFAARGGTFSKGYKFSGSNNIDDSVWYYENSSQTTHQVGKKSCNELGIFDMSGNVWEWCNDWYENYSYNSQTNPNGANKGEYKVLRGGGWDSDKKCCRVSYRDFSTPCFRGFNYGFRLVLLPN